MNFSVATFATAAWCSHVYACTVPDRIDVLIRFSFCCQQKSDRNQRVAKVISFIVRSRSKNERDFYCRSLVGCMCTRKCVCWIYRGRYMFCHRRIYFTIDRVGACLCVWVWISAFASLSARCIHTFGNLLFWWGFAVFFSLLHDTFICIFVYFSVSAFIGSRASIEHQMEAHHIVRVQCTINSL